MLFLEGVLGEGQPCERQRRRLEQRNHPDLMWVEPTYQHQGRLLSRFEAEEAGISRRTPPQLRLEQIRGVSRFLARQPVEAARGMVIIEAAEAMAESAANALSVYFGLAKISIASGKRLCTFCKNSYS